MGLYGGHPGNSFVISSAFKSYADMVTAFKQGPSYTAVWYNEYAIIDTPNKNDKDNGKIYQRGLNYQDIETGGAIYIAQVVGPSSGTPYMSLDTIESVKKESMRELEASSYRRYPVGKDSEGKFVTSDGSDGKQLATFNFDKNIEQGLVPGKYLDHGETKYNDNIKYTWVNIRQDNADSDSWFYVGMQNVYTVIDYAIHQNSPYDDQGNVKTDATDIIRVDTQEHPYYEKWDLGLPKGIKGDTLRNLRVITPTNALKNQIYSAEAIQVDSKTGMTTLGSAGYAGLEDDVAHQRQILVFDYYVYDKKMNPTPVMIYLGDFNQISNVHVSDDGTLTLEYTHNDDSVFSKKIKWIDSISLTGGNGKNGGHFTIHYNNGSAPFETDITWIKNIEIDAEGSVTFTYAGTNGGKVGADGILVRKNVLKWIKDVALNTNDGKFNVNFNYGDPYSTILDWVKDVQIDESTGKITLNHTTGDQVSLAKLKLLTKAETSGDGVITLHFNTGETTTIKQFNSEQDYHVKVLDDVKIETDILKDKRIQLRYNTSPASNPWTPIGDPINYIMGIVVRPKDWHLCILYSDPLHRFNPQQDGELKDGKDKNGVAWISNNDIRKFAPYIPDYGVEVYWQDMGTIKDQHGILVGFNVSYEDVQKSRYKNILEYLNTLYPTGLTGEQNMPGGAATKQKIITYSPNPQGDEKQDKEFYAFDYNVNKWYYLGTVADTGTRDIKILPDDVLDSSQWQNLSSQGVLFRQSSIRTNAQGLPKYWDIQYQAGKSR